MFKPKYRHLALVSLSVILVFAACKFDPTQAADVPPSANLDLAVQVFLANPVTNRDCQNLMAQGPLWSVSKAPDSSGIDPDAELVHPKHIFANRAQTGCIYTGRSHPVLDTELPHNAPNNGFKGSWDIRASAASVSGVEWSASCEAVTAFYGQDIEHLADKWVNYTFGSSGCKWGTDLLDTPTFPQPPSPPCTDPDICDD